MKTNIVDVFCIIDDFSKLFDEAIKKKTLEEADKKRRFVTNYNVCSTLE